MVVRSIWLWLALVATAYAEPGTDAGLVWRAPMACPDLGEVRARIERRLGMPLDLAVHGIEVDIAPDGDVGARRFVARIDLRAVTVANEVRVLTSARCDELVDAVAVVIARIAAEHRPAQVELSHRALATGAPPARPPAWGGGFRGLGVSGIGALPGVAVAGELAAYVRHRSVFAELAGVRWRAVERSDATLSTAALRIGWGSDRLPLRGWLAGELGSIAGYGINFDDGHVGSARWLAAGAGFGVAWEMTPHTRLIGIVELMVPLERARFVLQHNGAGYRPEPAAARSGFGLEVGWR